MNKMDSSANDRVTWIISPSIAARSDVFVIESVSCKEVLKSWRYSLFAHEWLDERGAVKKFAELKEKEQLKQRDVLTALKTSAPLEQPVLGIGINDEIEIGAGRAVFLTLCAEGFQTIPVYLPKSCLGEFTKFLA